MRMAVTIAAETGLRWPTCVATTRRVNARIAAAVSVQGLPRASTSTSAPLFTLPTRITPRRASARSSSGTPGSRCREGRRRRTGRRMSTTGTPALDERRGERTAQADERAPVHRLLAATCNRLFGAPRSTAADLERVGVEVQRHAVVADRGVGPQHATDGREHGVFRANRFVERHTQRGPPGLAPRADRQQRRSGGE